MISNTTPFLFAEGRRRSPTPPGGSPCSGRIRYSVLTSSDDDGDDLSYLGVGRDVGKVFRIGLYDILALITPGNCVAMK